MIIIGTKSDAEGLSSYYSDVYEAICHDVITLDNCYGSDRNIKENLGGFVCIIEDIADIDNLKNQFHLDIINDIFEDEETFDNYISRLFILSSDYVIKAYIRKELINV